MSNGRLATAGAVSGLFSIGFLVAAFSIGGIMGKARGKASKLTQAACAQIAAGDCDEAIATCRELQPLDPAAAHRIRGEAYERKGNLERAAAEYDASYANGNHVAGGSAERVRKKMKAVP